MEEDEKQRIKYLKEIKGLSPEKLVYIDESGIKLTTCKDRGWGKKGKPLEAKKRGKCY